MPGNSMLLFALFLVYGLCIGSFLNVVICRLPQKVSLVKGRSMCPNCRHTLTIADLVPVLSFLLLRGKCRYCTVPISWRYLRVELLTGLWFGLCSLFWGFSLHTLLRCLYGSVLICAWLIDVDETKIPDCIPIFILLLAAFSLFVDPVMGFSARLAGAIVVGGGMLLISLATTDSIGGGTIKLMTASGLLLGLKLILPAFLFACAISAFRWLLPYTVWKIPHRFHVSSASNFIMALMIMALTGDKLIVLYLRLF